MATIVTTSSSRPKDSPSYRTIAVAIIGIAAVAIIAYLLTRGSDKSVPNSGAGISPSSPTVQKDIKDPTSPTVRQEPSEKNPQVSIGKQNGSPSTVDGGEEMSGQEESRPTSPSDIEAPAKSNQTTITHRVMPQHRKYFDNPIENQLERLAIPGRNIRATPPLSKLTQEEILQYLRRPIQIDEDDDEEAVAAKERTAALKTEALKYIENGGTYDEFVREMVKVSNEEADMIRDARNEMLRLYKEEGAIAAIEYLKEANATLRENGLKEIPISTGLQKRAEEERAALEK
jgi:hypothetical protein